jgi:hypothetical protein
MASHRSFTDYAPSTRDLWGRELRMASHPDCLGACRSQEMRPSLVQAFFRRASVHKTRRQAGCRNAPRFKQFEKWAIVRDKLPRQITLGVGVETNRTDGGHIPWSVDHS